MNPAMLNIFLSLLWLLPLFAALAIGARMLGGATGDAAEPGTARWSTFTAASGFLLLAAMDVMALLHGAPGRVEFGDWFASGDLSLPLAVLADARALAFATLVQLIGWIVLRFSRTYLHRETGYHRFFLGMNLFMAGMQLIVLAGDGALTFVGWELAGFSSWLLIGYDLPRPAATGNALFAFITNRIGDEGFILGLALAFLWLGSSDWLQLSQHNLDKVSARMLLFGFVIAAFAKSAQLPLSSWLPRALEGPTPSSAIFYGAIMVHAGIWLLIRLEPVFLRVPDIMVQVALFGAATALWATLANRSQGDVKTSLVFATLTQLGLMVLEIGLGLFDLAFVHMLLHATWRAWQFLLAPSYMARVDGPARESPWLDRLLARWPESRRWLYGASLQRVWLEPLTQTVVMDPVQTIGRDLAGFDQRVMRPLLGERGPAARLLSFVAGRCAALEERLTQLASSGRATQLLRAAAGWFLEIEALLERPRYLLLMIAATFMVIL